LLKIGGEGGRGWKHMARESRKGDTFKNETLMGKKKTREAMGEKSMEVDFDHGLKKH